MKLLEIANTIAGIMQNLGHSSDYETELSNDTVDVLLGKIDLETLIEKWKTKYLELKSDKKWNTDNFKNDDKDLTKIIKLLSIKLDEKTEDYKLLVEKCSENKLRKVFPLSKKEDEFMKLNLTLHASFYHGLYGSLEIDHYAGQYKKHVEQMDKYEIDNVYLELQKCMAHRNNNYSSHEQYTFKLYTLNSLLNTYPFMETKLKYFKTYKKETPRYLFLLGNHDGNELSSWFKCFSAIRPSDSNQGELGVETKKSCCLDYYLD